jgi:hypothetical protein
MTSSIHVRLLPFAFALALAPACKDEDGDASDDGSSTGTGDDSADDDDDGNPSSNPSDPDASDDDPSDPDASDDDPSDPDATDAEATDPDSSGDDSDETATPGDPIYEESFDGADGSPWPDPWRIVGPNILGAELDGGRARMNGVMGHTARLVADGFDETNVEVNVTVEFENWMAQGYGFYVRQNGGALVDTDPPGQGYGVYTEGGHMQNLGLWKEINGAEMPIVEIPDLVPGGVEAGVPYHIRFQCYQNGDSTTLRAKMWRDGDDEPGAWMVETEDGTPELQDISGSFANDVYNYNGTGSVWVHHVLVSEL